MSEECHNVIVNVTNHSSNLTLNMTFIRCIQDAKSPLALRIITLLLLLQVCRPKSTVHATLISLIHANSIQSIDSKPC